MATFREFQRELKHWLESRNKIESLLKQTFNLRSQLTYLSLNQLPNAFQNNINPLRLNSELNITIALNLTSIRSLMLEMLHCLELLNCYYLQNNKSISVITCCCWQQVDNNMIQQLLEDIQQEYLFESNIIDSLDELLIADSIDNDAVVTILACYSYPPYLDIRPTSNINMIITQ